MHKTIASPDGGRHIDLSPEEEKKVKEEWAKNEAEAKAEQEQKEKEELLAKEALDAIASSLSPEAKQALMKKLNI